MLDATRLRVPFHADSSGRGPLMWGQTAIWDVFQWLSPGDASLNLMRGCPVPESADLDDVLKALRLLVERHDVLRTRFAQEDDAPFQEVCTDGELSVEVREIGTADPVQSAEEVGGELRAIPFDNAQDVPLIRVAVLTRDARPVHIVIAASHMAVDGWSFRIVLRDLGLLLSGSVLPPAGQQPLQRAAYEASDRGRRREAAALAFWAKHIEQAPASMLASVRGDAAPDFEWAAMDSPALALAARILGASTGVAPNQVLLASAALLLAFRTGEAEAVLRLIVSTRFQSDNRELVGAFNQNALFRVPVEDVDFETFLKAASEAALRSYLHSEYHPRKLEEMVGQIAEQRGIVADGYCFFNYVRFNDPKNTNDLDFPPWETLPAGLQARLGQTLTRRIETGMTPKGATFFFFLYGLGDNAKLTLGIDRRFLPDYAPEDFLGDLESLTVHAAAGGRTVADLRAKLG